MDIRTKEFEGWLWYMDDEGNWYEYPFEYTEETPEETQANIIKLLNGEDIEVDFEID